MKRVAVIGAGGCAREVAFTIRDAASDLRFAGFVVSDTTKLTDRDDRSRVLGDFDWLEHHRGEIDGLILGIGSPTIRARLADELSARFPDMPWPTVIHPTVRIDRESASIGRGVVVCMNAVATVNVVIADFVLIHYQCAIGHEDRLGRATVLNPAAVLSGGVTAGDEVLIGAGARVLQYRSVASRAVVGAGAVVTRDVAEGAVVAGVPARPLRPRS